MRVYGLILAAWGLLMIAVALTACGRRPAFDCPPPLIILEKPDEAPAQPLRFRKEPEVRYA